MSCPKCGKKPQRGTLFILYALAIVGVLAVSACTQSLTSGGYGLPTPMVEGGKHGDELTKEVREYQVVSLAQLNRNPKAFDGVKVQLRGTVFNLKEDSGVTFFQMRGPSLSLDSIAVKYKGSLPLINEGDAMTILGIGAGTLEGTTAFGGTKEWPLIYAVFVSKS